MSRSGNRHLRPDSTGKTPVLRAGPRTVRVCGDAAYLATPAGQHLAQMTVNLLAREYKVVEAVQIDVPEIPVHTQVFPGGSTKSPLRSALQGWGRAIAGSEIEFREVGSAEPASCTIHIGHGTAANTGLVIHTVADGWRFYCSTQDSAPSEWENDPNPLGPYIAACFAAGDAFKYFVGADTRTYACATLWNDTHGEWQHLERGRSPAGVELPLTYLIGAGAVGAAMVFALAATSGITGEMIILDPQRTDETNRNRLLSMQYHQLDDDKAALAAGLLISSGIRALPYVGRWPDYTADSERRTAPHIRAIEDAYQYQWVLSCVDRNVHRQAIAAYSPRIVIGGSTQDLTAQVALYSMRGACECLACNHPTPHLLSAEELTKELADKTPEKRREWYDLHDASQQERAAIEEFLIAPTCGSIGEQALTALHREGPTDWSVGFVSAGAGVILAATYLRAVLEGTDAVIAEGSERFAWFRNPKIGRSYAERKTSCNLCADPVAQARYGRLWGTLID